MPDDHPRSLYESAHQAMGRRDFTSAVASLERLLPLPACDAAAWRLYGFALRELQRMADAIAAFRRAAALDPMDGLAAVAVAETMVQSGLPALEEARRAFDLSGGSDSQRLLTLASALVAEGRREDACDLVAARVRAEPGWLEGQHRLAEMRWVGGDAEHFADEYVAGVVAEPRNLRLRLGWFRFLCQAKRWGAARRVLSDAEQVFGPQQVLLIAKCYLAAESGTDAEAESLFELTKGLQDNVRDLAWIRHCLRQRRPEAAEATALRMTSSTSANLVWPYLSLIWRMRQDPRALWLDGSPPFVRALDVDLAQGEREELAALLRSLHTNQAPYVEQSVRGGTQTERPLFFRTEPIITTVKERLTKAVRDYIDGLPAAVEGHPLLGSPRKEILYAGSWSVRLQRQGFNVAHTHPMGWLSSAFYVALPAKEQMGAAPAGWIRFGEPPPELGLDISAYAEVEPREGRLVLFPSTMWHSTVPFEAGERLVLAFDVRRPGA